MQCLIPAHAASRSRQSVDLDVGGLVDDDETSGVRDIPVDWSGVFLTSQSDLKEKAI